MTLHSILEKEPLIRGADTDSASCTATLNFLNLSTFAPCVAPRILASLTCPVAATFNTNSPLFSMRSWENVFFPTLTTTRGGSSETNMAVAVMASCFPAMPALNKVTAQGRLIRPTSCFRFFMMILLFLLGNRLSDLFCGESSPSPKEVVSDVEKIKDLSNRMIDEIVDR